MSSNELALLIIGVSVAITVMNIVSIIIGQRNHNRRMKIIKDEIRATENEIKELELPVVDRMTRPTCPECNRELVFVAVMLHRPDVIFRTWQCDCDYRQKDGDAQRDAPTALITAIVRIREHKEGAVTYEWGTDENDDLPYGKLP